MKMTEQNR